MILINEKTGEPLSYSLSTGQTSTMIKGQFIELNNGQMVEITKVIYKLKKPFNGSTSIDSSKSYLLFTKVEESI